MGITPARAGNSSLFHPTQSRKWDHPRSRGEQLPYLFSLPSITGSPPLARGTVLDICLPPLLSGITPARAGNSFVPS